MRISAQSAVLGELCVFVRKDAFEHDFHFDDVEVLPKPAQQPHPPVWMAASSEGAIDWAASRGFSILMDPHSSGPEIGAKRRYYAAKLAAAANLAPAWQESLRRFTPFSSDLLPTG